MKFSSFLWKQGPLAAPVLQHLTKEDLSKLYFGEFRVLDINGSQCFLTRTGYASFLNVWFYSNEVSLIYCAFGYLLDMI